MESNYLNYEDMENTSYVDYSTMETPDPTLNETTNRVAANNQLAVDIINDTPDYETKYLDNSNRTAKEIDGSLAETDYIRATENITQYLDRLAGASGDELMSGVDSAQQMQESAKMDLDSVLAPELAVVRSMNTSGFLTESEMYVAAERMRYSRIIAEYWDAVSTGKALADVLGLLLFTDISKDSADITGGSYFNSAEDWKRFITTFNNAPIEQRLQDFDLLFSHIMEHTEGNSYKFMNNMMELIDPWAVDSGEIDVEHALDKLDAAGYLTLVGTVIKPIIKGAHVISTAKKIGSLSNAAKLNEAALKSDTVASSMGMKRVDAAAAESPFNMPDDIFKGAPNGLEETVKREAQAIDDVIADAEQRAAAITPSLELSEDAINNAIALRKQQLAELDDVSNVKVVSHDGRGVVFSFDRVTKNKPPFDLEVDIQSVKEQIDKDIKIAESLADTGRVKGADIKATEALVRKAQAEFDSATTAIERAAAKKRLDRGNSALQEMYSKRNNYDAAVMRIDQGYSLLDELETKKIQMATDGRSRETVTMNFTRDDIGSKGFVNDSLTAVGSTLKGVLSPNFLFRQDSQKLVEGFTRALFASEIHRASFGKAFQIALNGVSKEGRTKLDTILRMGDKQERVYSFTDLKYGAVEGVQLSDKEIEAYYKIRHLMDKAYVLKNSEVRRKLTVDGARFLQHNNSGYFVKPYTDYRTAASQIGTSKYKTARVVNGPDGRSYELNLAAGTEDLKELYNRGYVLVRSGDQEFFRISDDAFSKFLVVRADEVGDLPAEVLNKRVGYMPREYKDGFYFVKERKYGKVDGKKTTVALSTKRYFSSKAEADLYAKSLNDEWTAAGNTADELPFMVRHDREMSNAEFDREVAGITGGMYTGARKEEALRQGLDGTDPEFIPALESMQKYFDHLSTKLPMAEFRTGITDAWLNHAKEMGALSKGFRGSFDEALDDVNKSTHVSATQKDWLRKAHEQISYQLRIPTSGEQEIASRVRSVAEWVEKKNWFGAEKNKKIVKSLHRFDHKDPISAMRSATFHAFLGFLSPVQFFVQAAGATVAFSLHPGLFPKAAPKAFSLAVLDNIHDQATLQKVMKTVFKDDPEIAEAYQTWRQTGLFESAVTSNADFRAMVQSNYIGRDQAGRLLDKGLLPYKSGELVNRRYSFATAYTKWKEANPGKAVDAQGVRDILADTNELLLQMQKTNKATWQKGAMSIPTQFMQIHTKFLEKLLGSKTSTADRVSLGLMQLGLFGTYGIPFSKHIAEAGLQGLGYEPGDLDETTATTLREGLIGTVVQHMFGMDVSVVPRAAIGKGLEEALIGFWTGEASLTDVALGASGGFIDRTFKSTMEIKHILSGASYNPANMTTAEAAAAADAALDIISSWNNASAAYTLFTSPVFRNAKGQIMLYSDDLNFQTKVGKALGFQLKDLEEIYYRNMEDVSVNQRIQDKKNTFMQYYANIAESDGTMSDEQRANMVNMLSGLIGGEAPAVQQKIKDSIVREMFNVDSKYSRAINKQWQRELEGLYSSGDVLNPLPEGDE